MFVCLCHYPRRVSTSARGVGLNLSSTSSPDFRLLTTDYPDLLHSSFRSSSRPYFARVFYRGFTHPSPSRDRVPMPDVHISAGLCSRFLCSLRTFLYDTARARASRMWRMWRASAPARAIHRAPPSDCVLTGHSQGPSAHVLFSTESHVNLRPACAFVRAQPATEALH